MIYTTHHNTSILNAPNQYNYFLDMFIFFLSLGEVSKFLLLCVCVVNLCVLRTPVRYPVMCTLGFIVINLVLVLVTVTIAICVFGSPVLSCYMYTCTFITFLGTCLTLGLPDVPLT